MFDMFLFTQNVYATRRKIHFNKNITVCFAEPAVFMSLYGRCGRMDGTLRDLVSYLERFRDVLHQVYRQKDRSPEILCVFLHMV